ncbi:smoothened homolog [Patiria miniata]|uniref:Protein smoothened n=1 Tax=Patiria miniata TaxID=46514 RepID=A0A913ZLF8_PATMI|nr:smoothened homolog [Patiria miniata]
MGRFSVTYCTLTLLAWTWTIPQSQAVNLTIFDGLGAPSCKRPSTCVPVMNSTCLGSSIQHSFTSLDLANDSVTQEDILRNFRMWEGLRLVPKCWEVVQPFLCAVYLPKCEDGMVELPSYDMCSVTREPCRIVDIEHGWPEFVTCDESRFPPDCDNVYKSITFNTTGECEPPLVATDNEKSWYETVEGCGIQCRNPLFTDEEHAQVHLFIAVFASACVVCTFFTLITFCADWKNSSKYPALILFYMNGCFFAGSVGFLAQFPSGARDDIICRKDGTMRLAEPSDGENLSCIIIFILVYYFIIAGVIWFVWLAYAWHLSFRALGTPRQALKGKTSYFHLLAWSLPFILVVIIVAINEVDGDSVSGICFVGYQNHYYRAGFVLLPIGIMLVVGGFFLMNGLKTLCTIDRDNPGLLSDKAAHRIKGTIIRIGVFAFLAFLFVFITFASHLYEFTNQESWKRGFQDYLVCEANVTFLSGLSDKPVPTCALNSRPNISVIMVHLFSMFGAGIAMSMWVWTPSSLAIWQRTWRKITRQAINEPQRLKKSRMIAKAFAKKMEKKADDNDDALSVSFESASHDDAIGMKLDLPKSSVTEDSSSVWGQGNNVPARMLMRRGGGALPLPVFATNASSPRNSPDSQLESRPPTAAQANHNIVQAEVVIEPPPPNMRKSRRNKRRDRSRRGANLPLHGPSGRETPMHDPYVQDDMETIPGSEEGVIGAPNRGARRARHSFPSEISDLDSVARKSTVPKLPAIQRRQVSFVAPPADFDLPSSMSIDSVV